MRGRPEINFDKVAPYYDKVLQLCFGNRITRLEQQAIEKLSHGESALVVGGGSGRTTRLLSASNKFKHIHQHELSPAMNRMAQARGGYDNKRCTFGTDLSAIERCTPFDVIIFPFVLDCYQESSIPLLIEEHKKWMKPNAEWLIIDFSSNGESLNRSRWLRSVFIGMLYQFFRVSSGISANALPRIANALTSCAMKRGWTILETTQWFEASVWKCDTKAVVSA